MHLLERENTLNRDTPNYNPIIIVGAGRSGTKFVRSLLAASSQSVAVPYDVNYIWRYRHEHLPHDAIPAENCTPAIARYISKMIWRLADDPDNSAPVYVVEKTVSNCLRVDFVNKVFPTAKFIHLLRDGRAVVESSWRMWRQKPSKSYMFRKLRYMPLSSYRYGFWYMTNLVRGRLSGRSGTYIWGPRYPGIQEDLKKRSVLEVCAIQWRECVEAALDAFERIPPERHRTIRFEDLVNNPECIRDLAGFLGFGDEESIIKQYSGTVEKSNNYKWRARFSSAELVAIWPIIQKTMRTCGYSLDR